MRSLINALVLAGLVLAVAAEAAPAATTWYVQAGAPGGGTGTSANPYNTIQAAITSGTTLNGDTVTVRPGTYYEHINFISKNITVQSTSATTPAVVAATIINGQGAGPIVTFSSGEGSGAVLQGFTITNGAWAGAAFPDTGAAGIFVLDASPTIGHNVIAGNNTADDGGAICILGGSSPTVLSNTISGNSAGLANGGWGGGIFCYSDGTAPAAPQILSNCIAANQSGFDGGGLAVYCVAAYTGTNETDYYPIFMTPTIGNNIVVTNSSGGNGGGLFVGVSVLAAIVNDTITGNIALSNSSLDSEGNGGGISFDDANVYSLVGGSPVAISSTVDSCLIYSNSAVTSGSQVSLENGSLVAIYYSDLQGGQAAVYVQAGTTPADTLTYGAGNLATNPLFGSPATADYHLQSRVGRYNPATGGYLYDAASSPGIDAGDPAFIYSGQPLPNGGRIEMGAYGNTAQASLAGTPLTITATLLYGWVYQSAADAAPYDTLTIAVNSDPLSDTSYSVSASSASGSGQVTFASGSNSSTVYIYGGLSVTGTCQIQVQVAGNSSGDRGTVTLTMSVRPLGDINGTGTVDANDRITLDERLNNLPTGLPDYSFDLTGDGYVTAADRVLLNKILNKLTP